MATIPQEIIHEILLSLPPKSLVRFKCVCKAWKRHFESSDFIRNHLHRCLQPEWDHSSLILTCGSSLYVVDDLDDNPSLRPRELALPRSFDHNNGIIKVVGSSNGLLCIASGATGLNHYFLCNPSNPNGSFKILPFAHDWLSEHAGWLNPVNNTDFNVISGFGYDQVGDDYKIVYGWFYRTYHGLNYFSEVLLYSSIVGSWKSIGIPEFGMGFHNDSVLCNNRLHWIISEHKIVCIDLHDEQWYKVDLPDSWMNNSIQDICVLGGCFGAIVFDCGEAELWVMRQYNVKESWESLFTLPNITLRSVLYYSTRQDQALLLLVDGARRDLGWYCLREKLIIQRVEIPDEIEFCRFKSFVGSLVPLTTKRSRQEHGDESNAEESKVEETETDQISESLSSRQMGRRRRKKRNLFI